MMYDSNSGSGTSARYKVAAIAIGVIMVAMAISKWLSLRTFFFDLGVFDFLLFNVEYSGEWGRVLFGHAHIFAFLYASLLSMVPVEYWPATLVGFQAAVLVIPVYIFGHSNGWLIGLMYALYTPVWINQHFDFHFDHLAVPLLLIFYLALSARRPYLSMIAALLLMGVKEPFALQTAACGLFSIYVGMRGSMDAAPLEKREFTRSKQLEFIGTGLALVVAGGCYFYFSTRYLIPYFSDGVSGGVDSSAFSWLGQTPGEMVFNVFSHPIEILQEILDTTGKLVYLFVVFGLLAFIPLLAPSYLVPALPLLAIAMLSRLPNHYDYNTHYTAGLIIPVMFAFLHGIPKAHALWMKGAKRVWLHITGAWTALAFLKYRFPHKPDSLPQLGRGSPGVVTEEKYSKLFYVLLVAWVLAGHILFSPSPISRLFWSDKIWSHSWRAYVPTGREVMMTEAMLKYIPTDPEVSVTAQNSVNWPHLAHRKVYEPFPAGIEEPVRRVDWSSRTWDGFWRFVRAGEIPPTVTRDRYADYVVLDLKRPWFLVDKGCEWIYGECRDKEMGKKFLDWAAYTRSVYDTVFEQDGFMILRRRST